MRARCWCGEEEDARVLNSVACVSYRLLRGGRGASTWLQTAPRCTGHSTSALIFPPLYSFPQALTRKTGTEEERGILFHDYYLSSSLLTSIHFEYSIHFLNIDYHFLIGAVPPPPFFPTPKFSFFHQIAHYGDGIALGGKGISSSWRLSFHRHSLHPFTLSTQAIITSTSTVIFCMPHAPPPPPFHPLICVQSTPLHPSSIPFMHILISLSHTSALYFFLGLSTVFSFFYQIQLFTDHCGKGNQTWALFHKRVTINRKLRLIATCTHFEWNLRLIVTLYETGPSLS